MWTPETHVSTRYEYIIATGFGKGILMPAGKWAGDVIPHLIEHDGIYGCASLAPPLACSSLAALLSSDF